LEYNGSKGNSANFLASLDNKISQGKLLITQSRASRAEVEKLEASLKSFLVNLAIAETCERRLKANVKNLNEYLSKKKSTGLKSIHSGMLAARTIIPHGDRVRLYVDGEDAYLGDEKGYAVNEKDGSAFRATLSMFMRDRLLKATDCIQTMVLDEPLSTLDLDNSAEISKYINVMATTAPVILIEQKPEIFVSTKHIAYHFQIIEGQTIITRRENVEESNH